MSRPTEPRKKPQGLTTFLNGKRYSVEARHAIPQNTPATPNASYVVAQAATPSQ
jgi:hypothetical protein